MCSAVWARTWDRHGNKALGLREREEERERERKQASRKGQSGREAKTFRDVTGEGRRRETERDKRHRDKNGEREPETETWKGREREGKHQLFVKAQKEGGQDTSW